jgi:endoglucanase
MRRASWRYLAAMVLCFTVIGSLVAVDASGRSHRHRHRHRRRRGSCVNRYPRLRDPANPLALSTAPGSDPLNGAPFFVNGPRYGDAAGEIARLLGINPRRFGDRYSWTRFRAKLERGSLHGKLLRDPMLRFKINELEKIASQPEAQRFSAYSGGGGPGKVFQQVRKILCHNLLADPGTVPIITTYFLHPDIGRCPSAAGIASATPTFERQIGEVARGTGRHPVVFLLELDAIGSSHCMVVNHDLPQYLALLRYEIDRLAALPHTVVYVEAGYSDGPRPDYAARALNEAGMGRIRGFFTNDTHENWTLREVRWAERVANLTHGAHFIVNTAQNGRGPLKNPHPATEGTNDLCNPPGRGIGPRDTTQTGFARADAFLWTHVPGNSSGPCNGGPPSGVFWPTRAIGLASRANAQLGPGWPSHPY